LNKVLDLIPGMGSMKLPKEAIDVQQDKLEKWRHVMDSMTKGELENPEDIDGQRVERISKGSGCPTTEVRSLLKQYRQSKKMMKMMKGGGEKGMEKMMQKLQKGQLKMPGGKGMKLK